MEPKFVIEGSSYPVPDWISFTMNESEILYDKAKLTLADVDEDTKFTPGLLSALMIVAYMRGNPGLTRKAAEVVVGEMVLADALEHLFPKEEDASPPSAAPNETPSLGGDANSGARNESTGSDSVTDSETTQASVVPLPSGTPPSDTQPTSDPETLAV